MDIIKKLMRHILKAGFSDYDIVDQDEARELTITLHKIFVKYKNYNSRAKHFTQELVDRNFIYGEEDEIGCREFIRGYFVGLSEK